MALKNILCCLLTFVALIGLIMSQSYQQYVDIVCSEARAHFNYIGEIQEVCNVSSTLSVTNFNAKVKKVLFKSDSSIVAQSIEAVFIYNAHYLYYLPQGIKKSFPRMKILEITGSGLKHLDQNDMRQFRSDLQWIRISDTKLTALDGDLFMFNPNLVYVNFNGNSLKYIDPLLFASLKRMKNLEVFDFERSGCTKTGYGKRVGKESIQSFNWDQSVYCYSESAKVENMNKIELKREIKKSTEEMLIDSYDDARYDIKRDINELSLTVKRFEVQMMKMKIDMYDMMSKLKESLNENLKKDKSETTQL